MTEEVLFSGEIASIFFSNPSNFYKVLLLQIEDTDSDYGDSEIVVTGTIGDVIEGEAYDFYGQLVQHPKYGQQLLVMRYEKSLPKSNTALVRFLSSDQFPGIGKATAEKIVTLYPENTLNAILDSPQKLVQILSAAKRNSFIKRLTESVGSDRVLVELQKYGLPANVNLRIIEEYHEEALKIIEETPYRLVEEIRGVGFKLADKIAEEQGVAADDEGRIRAGLLHSLRTQSMSTGDTYVEKVELIYLTQNLLEDARQIEISAPKISQELTSLVTDGKVQAVEDKIFVNSLYFAEESVAQSLLKMTKNKDLVKFDKSKIEQALAKVQKKLAISYDESQTEAIEKAINHQFSLLTGGPGTGKTTIIQGLIEVYAVLHKVDLEPSHYTETVFPIVLAAPTGRAARRLSETTGLPAATLHRQLGIGTEDAVDDATNDLSGSLLIVDEFSMVDTWLAAKLFKAIPANMQVVFVGDSDQLPSVSPGQVFADLFKVPDLTATVLTHVYRQSEKSTILDLAASIKAGELPANLTERQADRSFFAAHAEAVPYLIRQIAESWKRRGNDPFELQVLSPMYRGAAGVDNLNHILQEIFNPQDERGLEFAYKNLTFREGDKILHLVNDAELGVFNGDLGAIIELRPSKYTESKQDELLLDFDGQEVNYPRSDWYKLTLAYAMSIHKAQGSEFQTVVLPLVANFSRMLQRNLLYTAVTRARQSLILLGEVSAFETAVARISGNRKTWLVERLTSDTKPVQLTDKSEKIKTWQLTEDLINSEEIDALIGLSEKDFALLTK